MFFMTEVPLQGWGVFLFANTVAPAGQDGPASGHYADSIRGELSRNVTSRESDGHRQARIYLTQIINQMVSLKPIHPQNCQLIVHYSLL